jgi:hypothetical protein
MPLNPLLRSAGRITTDVMNSKMTINGAIIKQLIVVTSGLPQRFFEDSLSRLGCGCAGRFSDGVIRQTSGGNGLRRIKILDSQRANYMKRGSSA